MPGRTPSSGTSGSETADVPPSGSTARVRVATGPSNSSFQWRYAAGSVSKSTSGAWPPALSVASLSMTVIEEPLVGGVAGARMRCTKRYAYD
ncbi:hypothetical protein [Tomitella cavernea]|uniref:hypothetical protein n=1 Tax=Tomitella cavernea TaxID=1387982 RepID=UPI001904A738|nr:hypothetical protein [Tomitella cavernea]